MSTTITLPAPVAAYLEAKQRYDSDAMVAALTEDAAAVGERTVVAVRVAGNFPGSPVTLYFYFTLRDDLVAALTILA